MLDEYSCKAEETECVAVDLSSPVEGFPWYVSSFPKNVPIPETVRLT